MIAESVADRRPPSRKRGSKVVSVVDPFRRRAIWCESGLEESWAQVLIAHPEVAEVREQQKLSIVMNDVPRTHFFDLSVTRVCGRRDANAVKYRDQVDQDLLDLLECAADTVGDRFADRYAILDDRVLTETMIANARDVISCAKDYDFEAQDFIVDCLRNGNPDVTLAECDAIVGEGRRGSRAATALIQKGKLVLKRGQRLGPNAVLNNGYAF
jgi:hypothetical protein